MGVLNKKFARKILYATPTNPSVLPVPQIIIIIAAPTPFYVVHTINRSAYRESLENHRYYLCHVSLQLKLCYIRTTKDQ